MEKIDIDISVVTKEQRSDQPIIILFSIVNNGDQTVYVSRQNTPLEGLVSDCLLVTRNGEPVRYDGIKVKRALDPEEFIRLEPGETHRAEVDITRAYPVGEGAGDIQVQFKRDKLLVMPEPPSEQMLTLRKRKPRTESLTPPEEIVRSTPATLRLLPSGQRPLTLGEEARAKKKDQSEMMLRSLVVALKDPLWVGGDPDKVKAIKRAHKRAHIWVKRALDDLKNNTYYRRWFGAYSAQRLGRVRTIYESVKDRLQKKVFTYYVTHPDANRKWYAFTYYGVEDIYLCRDFWPAPSTGASSKAGTFVHEHTHAAEDTEDFEYGEADCKQLAIDDPDAAINNADGFEFYCEYH
jgi:peptidyl-Lys metalloendopeptidase